MIHSSKKNKKALTWRNIEQKDFLRSASEEGQKRKRYFWMRRWLLGMIVIGVVLGGGYWYINGGMLKDKQWGRDRYRQAPLGRVQFETNGVLTHAWVKELLFSLYGNDLGGIDIHSVQKSMERIDQIKAVSVQKVYPDTLHIQVQEHTPVARVATQSANKKLRIFFVSSEGHLFFPIGYNKKMIDRLPFIQGVRLMKRNDQFLPIEKMPMVAKLLERASMHKPHLYANWKVIVCDSLSTAPEDPWSVIKVKTKYNEEIIFSVDNFDQQLNRLEDILKEVADKRLGLVKKIDLTLGNHAVVQMVKTATRRSH